jgi:Cu+-exporting ATPase
MIMTTQTFEVAGMNCTACVMHIEGIEDEIEGIESVDVNFRKQRMVVEYDNSKVTELDIVRAVKQIGYTAIGLENE